MCGGVSAVGRLLLLAALLVVFAAGDAGAASLPDGEWEGRWEPGGSCRDTRERRVTARTEGGRIHGQVHNPPANPAVFVADVKPSGSFSSTIHGLKRFGFSVKGRATPTEIKANWEGRDDCGTGRFVLRPIEVAKPAEDTAPAPAEWVEPQNPPAPAGSKDSARTALDTLRAQGVISAAEYQAKLKALEPAPPAMLMAPSDLPPVDPRLSELDDLLTSGAIGADEYLARRRAIVGQDN